MTRSLRASKPISSLPEFEGTLALTRLLTRRLHVSSLSVCRHCVAHLASLFVVKPHGPGRLKTEASSRPGFIDLHLAHSTSSPPSIPTSLSHSLCSFLRTLQQHWKLSVAADPDGPHASESLWKSESARPREGGILRVQLSAGVKDFDQCAGYKRESGDSILVPYQAQYATLCRRTSLRTATTSQVGSRTELHPRTK